MQLHTVLSWGNYFLKNIIQGFSRIIKGVGVYFCSPVVFQTIMERNFIMVLFFFSFFFLQPNGCSVFANKSCEKGSIGKCIGKFCVNSCVFSELLPLIGCLVDILFFFPLVSGVCVWSYVCTLVWMSGGTVKGMEVEAEKWDGGGGRERGMEVEAETVDGGSSVWPWDKLIEVWVHIGVVEWKSYVWAYLYLCLFSWRDCGSYALMLW